MIVSRWWTDREMHISSLFLSSPDKRYPGEHADIFARLYRLAREKEEISSATQWWLVRHICISLFLSPRTVGRSKSRSVAENRKWRFAAPLHWWIRLWLTDDFLFRFEPCSGSFSSVFWFRCPSRRRNIISSAKIHHRRVHRHPINVCWLMSIFTIARTLCRTFFVNSNNWRVHADSAIWIYVSIMFSTQMWKKKRIDWSEIGSKQWPVHLNRHSLV